MARRRSIPTAVGHRGCDCRGEDAPCLGAGEEGEGEVSEGHASIWGDMGRYGEIWGDGTPVPGRGSHWQRTRRVRAGHTRARARGAEGRLLARASAQVAAMRVRQPCDGRAHDTRRTRACGVRLFGGRGARSASGGKGAMSAAMRPSGARGDGCRRGGRMGGDAEGWASRQRAAAAGMAASGWAAGATGGSGNGAMEQWRG